MAFEALDMDHTSLLDAETIRKALGEDVQIEDVEEMLGEIGEAKDGKISYGKFLKYWREMMFNMNVRVPMRHYYAAIKESVVSNVINPIGCVIGMLGTGSLNSGSEAEAEAEAEAESRSSAFDHSQAPPTHRSNAHDHSHQHSHQHSHEHTSRHVDSIRTTDSSIVGLR